MAGQHSSHDVGADWLPQDLPGRPGSSGDTPKRTRFDDIGVWRAGISRAFVPLAPEPIGDGPFDASFSLIKRGAVNLARIEGSPQRVRRGAREISISQGDVAYLNIQLSGVGKVRGGGGVHTTAPGSGAIVLAEQLFELAFETRFSQLCVAMPRDWLAERVQLPLGIAVTRSVDMLSGSGRVVRAALGALIDATDPHEVAECGDLFATTLDHSLRSDWSPVAAAGGRPLMQAVRRLIALRLSEEALSPAIAAAALGCSVRTLHSACQHEGRSFGRMLREARLDAAQKALRSARSSPGRVGPIAFACGFSDLSHFSRAFRARFGYAPSDCSA